MKAYTVTIPFAGHIGFEIEAESEEEALEKAFNSEELNMDNCIGWEALDQFNEGNVCYCPHPWEATAELAWGEEPDGE